MKQEIIGTLERFRDRLQALRKAIKALTSDRVSTRELRQEADAIASMWVEELRSPLEHRYKLDSDVIKHTADQMKRLHILSRPNNRKSSYVTVLSAVLRGFNDKLILPIKQTASHIEKVLDLAKLIPELPKGEESEYLQEAVECAAAGHSRAAIVMGWCCAIDRLQRKIVSLELGSFNAASRNLKARRSGKFKRWNKEFSISTMSELQAVFDTDLIVVLEGMGLLDGNEAQRLETCFQYRNHSAHPGHAPIHEAHVVSFFTDITSIVLQNPQFAL
jgi:hypothetical protein